MRKFLIILSVNMLVMIIINGNAVAYENLSSGIPSLIGADLGSGYGIAYNQIKEHIRDSSGNLIFGIVRIGINQSDWQTYGSSQWIGAAGFAVKMRCNQANGGYIIAVCGFDESTISDQNMQNQYASFCADFANTLHKAGYDNIIYELGNEENNVGYFSDKPEQYATFANNTASAIRAKYSNAIICTAGILKAFNANSWSSGWSIRVINNINWKLFNFFGVHSYDGPSGSDDMNIPEAAGDNNNFVSNAGNPIGSQDTLDDSLIYMQQHITQYNKHSHILLTEGGWDSKLIGNDDWRTAFYCRLALICIRRSIEGCVWFAEAHGDVSTDPGKNFYLPDKAYDCANCIKSYFPGNPQGLDRENGNYIQVNTNPNGEHIETCGQVDASGNINYAIWLRRPNHDGAFTGVDPIGTSIDVSLTLPNNIQQASYNDLSKNRDPTTPISLTKSINNHQLTVSVSGLPILISFSTTPIPVPPPQISSSLTPSTPSGQNGWYVSDPTLTLTTSDTGGPGIQSVTYSIDGSAPVNYTGPVTITGDVQHTYQGWVTDTAGTTVSTGLLTCNVDTTPPNILFTAPATGTWINGNPMLSWTGTDALSGAASVTLQWDNGPSQTEPVTGSIAIPEGQHTATFTATDNAGNISAPQTVGPFWVDNTPPIVSATLTPATPDGANGWYVTNPNIIINASDPTSGIADESFSFDGNPAVEWTMLNWLYKTTITGDGQHTYQGFATDNAGNTASTAIYTVNIDTSPPVFTALTVPATTGCTNTLAASWSAADPQSGVTEYDYAIGSTPGGTDIRPRTTTGMQTFAYSTGLNLTVGQSYYFTIWAQNGAGLSSSASAFTTISLSNGLDGSGAMLDAGGVSTVAHGSANYALTDSLGQCVVDVSQSAMYLDQHGYWHPDDTSTYQPDLLIYATGDTAYIGGGIYNTTGAGQTRGLVVKPNVTAIYYFHVQNRGNASDIFTVTAPAGGNGWKLVYKDMTTTLNDITTAITSAAGWSSGPLAPSAYKFCRVEVTPDTTVAINAVNTVTISAVSTSDLTKIDAIQAITTVIGPQLTLGKSASTPSARWGDRVTYNLNYCNYGDATATNAVLTDVLPAGISYVTNSAGSASSYTATTNTLTWKLGALYAGATGTVTFQATVNATTPIGANIANTATISCLEQPAPVVSNEADVTVTATCQPDMLIYATGDTAYIGGGIYNTTGVGQTRGLAVKPNVTAIYYFHVQNRGNATDIFTVTAPAGGSGWKVVYKDLTTTLNDITTAITSAAGWSSGPLAPNAYKFCRVEVTPDMTVVDNAVNTVTISAVSITDPTKQDVADALTTLSLPYLPDLLIYATGDTAYIGAAIFNTTGAGQTRNLTTVPNVAATYYFHAQNDGNTTDIFTIKAPPGGSGWKLVYKDMTTTLNDVTTAITSAAGWSTGPVAPGGYKFFSVQVTPDNTVACSAINTVTIAVASNNEPTRQDVVKAVTTAGAGYQPDLLIYATGDAAYIGGGSYNTTGAGQTRGLTVKPNVTAIYYFHVQNCGTGVDTFTVKAPAGAYGWKLVYKDLTTTLNDVTTAITSAVGWSTGPLAPGAYKFFSVQVTPDGTVACSAVNTVTITAVSTTDPTKQDVVKALTTAGAGYQPDLAVYATGDSDYIGVNIVNLTGAGQTRSLAVKPNVTAIYYFHVMNSGNTTDVFSVQATGSSSGWKVVYNDLTSTLVDITNAITSASCWSSGPLARGAYKFLRVLVTPDSTVTSGAVNTLTVTAVSAKDVTKQDVVKAVTTRQ